MDKGGVLVLAVLEDPEERIVVLVYFCACITCDSTSRSRYITSGDFQRMSPCHKPDHNLRRINSGRLPVAWFN